MAAQRLLWLDLIRGLSALAVAAGHLRLVMMCGYSELPDPTVLQTLFFLLTGLSSQAVFVFFVLSGFLVGGSVLRQGGSFHLWDYLLARVVRLWVVLIPALFFTLTIDRISLAINPEVLQGGNYARWTSGPMPGGYSSSLVTFLGNLAFVNTIFVSSFGSNGPLWSLACEFWYYVLFPLLARALGLIGSRPRGWQRLVFLLAALAILAFMPKLMLTGFLAWLMGVAAAVGVNRCPTPPRVRSLLLTTALVGLTLVISKLDYFEIRFPVDPLILLSMSSALLIYQLARIERFPRFLQWLAINLAKLSYSFYLVHFPVTVLIGVTIYDAHVCQATTLDLLIFLGWLAALLFLSIPFWWLFERQTPWLRQLTRQAIQALSRRPWRQPLPWQNNHKTDCVIFLSIYINQYIKYDNRIGCDQVAYQLSRCARVTAADDAAPRSRPTYEREVFPACTISISGVGIVAHKSQSMSRRYGARMVRSHNPFANRAFELRSH